MASTNSSNLPQSRSTCSISLAPSYDSDDDTLVALTSLPKMELKCFLRLNNEDKAQKKTKRDSTGILLHVQKMDQDDPNDPKVRHVVSFVQQCVGNGEKQEVPEGDDDRKEYDEQQEQLTHLKKRESVKADGFCMEQADQFQRVNVVSSDLEDSSDRDGQKITEEMSPRLSNQAEDESCHVDTTYRADSQEEASTCVDDTDIEELDEENSSLRISKISNSRLRMLPILTANMTVKGVHVPPLLRGREIRYRNALSDHDAVSRKSAKFGAERSCFRHKVQFFENELQLWKENENDTVASPSSLIPSYRRFSVNSKITRAVPLRRKSFSMKRTSLKSTGIVGSFPNMTTSETSKASALSSAKLPRHLVSTRRQSASICHLLATSSPSTRRHSTSFVIAKQRISVWNSKKTNVAAAVSRHKTAADAPRSPCKMSQPPVMSTTQSQMVLRVRERSSDGVPELVIAKKPVHFIAWHWYDRCIRVPFLSAMTPMELGPAQHGIMLRQLRYVKSQMYELPWAKAHLRALLSKYTAKELSKEDLYPRLNALGEQVQRDSSLRARQHRVHTAQKQRLTVTLTLATSVVNDSNVTKFGRRGRPHASRLLFDPNTPLQLRWRRKHGERSVEYLAVDEIHVVEGAGSMKSFGRGNRRAAAAVAIDPESCLSLVTPTRSLDLQVASSLHREWLANAVRDLVCFAQQYKTVDNTTDGESDCLDAFSSTQRH